jgi:hypothetical protein
MPDTKDVEIGGLRYQIGRFRARDGSWVLAQVLTKMMPTMLEAALRKKSSATLPAGRVQIAEDEFANIQAIALSVCRRYNDAGVPMPVFVRPDTFAAPDLEYDVVAVMRLTIEALVFNLSPFFADGGLSQILQSLPVPILTDPQT